MRGGCSLLALAAALGASIAVGTALAGESQQVEGARYTFAASSPNDRASGRGAFDRTAQLGGGGYVRISRGALRVEAKVRTWKLSILGTVATLALRVEITASSDREACPIGAKGVTTLTDDSTDPALDRVKTTFSGRRCAPLARMWSADSGGGRTRVSIEALLA